MDKPTIRKRRMIMEPGGDILAMDESGVVRVFATPEAVVGWVRRRDTASAARGMSTATFMEWRGFPEGFQAPD